MRNEANYKHCRYVGFGFALFCFSFFSMYIGHTNEEGMVIDHDSGYDVLCYTKGREQKKKERKQNIEATNERKSEYV